MSRVAIAKQGVAVSCQGVARSSAVIPVPCLCDPKSPTCCVCRTGHVGQHPNFPSFWGGDACAGPIGCCIGRAFRTVYTGKVISTRVNVPTNEQWSSVLDASAILEIYPSTFQPSPTSCNHERTFAESYSSLGGSYTGPSGSTGGSVNNNGWAGPPGPDPSPWWGPNGPNFPWWTGPDPANAANVAQWALPTPSLVVDPLVLLPPPLLTLMTALVGATAAQGMRPYDLFDVPCDPFQRYPWEINCADHCALQFPGTLVTKQVTWNNTQTCKRTTIDIFLRETQEFAIPPGMIQAERTSHYTASLEIQTLLPCLPVAIGPGGGDRPADPRVLAVPPWASQGCCG